MYMYSSTLFLTKINVTALLQMSTQTMLEACRETRGTRVWLESREIRVSRARMGPLVMRVPKDLKE